MASEIIRSAYATAIMPQTPRPGNNGSASMETLQGTLLPNKLFIGGLAEQTNEKDLRGLLAPLCDVKEVKIITDRTLNSKSGEPRRYAFVELTNSKDEKVDEDVKKVVEWFQKRDVELHGRRLNVAYAYKKVPTFGRIFVPGMQPNGGLDEQQSALFLQWFLFQQQQQRMMAASPYGIPFGYPMQVQQQVPAFTMPPNHNLTTTVPNYPSPMGMQTAMSQDLRTQAALTQFMTPQTSYMNRGREQGDQLYRTSNGFVQANGPMRGDGQVHFNGHH